MNVHVVVAIPNASVVDNTRLATNVLFTVIIMTTEVSPFIRQCITDYVEALIQKLQKRAAKHPEDNFLSLDKESLAEYNTQSLENHLIEEFGEFIATMDNPPLFLKDFAIRVLGPGDHAKHSVDFESKKTELRDLGNMCLILYSAYSARSESRCKDCGCGDGCEVECTCCEHCKCCCHDNECKCCGEHMHFCEVCRNRGYYHE